MTQRDLDRNFEYHLVRKQLHRQQVPCGGEEYRIVHEAATNIGLSSGPVLERRLNIYVYLLFDKEEALPDRWKHFFKKLAGPYGEVMWKAYQKRRS